MNGWSSHASRLAGALAMAGMLQDPAWWKAFATTPRHVFVPRFYRLDTYNQPRHLVTGDDPSQQPYWWEHVYNDEVLVTHYQVIGAMPDGQETRVASSSASTPSVTAVMLDRLHVTDGHRILEIGTGTGYTTALLANRLGDQQITSIEIDPATAAEAAQHLATAGLAPTLAVGDGHHGYPPNAPYDRILSTCAIDHIPPAWIEQLVEGGIIVAPLTLHGGPLDLQCAGGTAAQLARTVLRWSVGLMNAPMGRDLAVGLAEAVGCLAHRAGWASFDAGQHDAGRQLFTVALDAAVRAGDRDLRGYVLADISAQHNYLGYPNDAIELIGLAEGDPRICHAVRMALAGVKARSHAAMGDREQVRRYLDLVDESHVRSREVRFDDWRDTVSTAGQMLAVTGHAAAMLARSSLDDADRTYAVDRLSAAVDKLDPVSHTRAYGLCLLRLAALHVGADPDMALSYAKQALGLPEGLGLRSERFARAVGVLRAAATANDDATSAGIVELIDQQTTRDREGSDGHGSDGDASNGGDPGLSEAGW